MQQSSGVMVVGAGPVGLVTSLMLARRGHSVTLVERFAAAYPLPRAVGMSHESVRILQDTGVGTELAELLRWDDRCALGLCVTHAGEVLMQMPFRAMAESGWPEMQCFNQPDIERLLEAQVHAQPNIRFERNSTVVGARQDDEGVDVILQRIDGANAGPDAVTTTLRTGWLVGCDGANSVVRTMMGTAVTDLGFAWDWLVVDIEPTVERDWWPYLGQVLAPPRSVTWAPSGPNRRRFEFMLRPEESREAMSTPDAAWRLLADCDVRPDNARLVRHAMYTFRAKWADHWRSGRLLLAGDAAHLMPPFLGQGLNSGLRDAATLTWRLDLVMRGIAPADTLDDYTTERLEHVREVIEQAVAIGRLLCVADEQGCEERDDMLRWMRDTPEAPPPTAPWRLGRGALAENDDKAGLLGWQGNVRLDGREGRFDDLLGSGHFVLLGRQGDPVDGLTPEAASLWRHLGGISVHIGPGSSVVDVDGTYARWYEQTGSEVILVRPDFYVFGTGRTSADAEGLVRQLARHLQLALNS